MKCHKENQKQHLPSLVDSYPTVLLQFLAKYLESPKYCHSPNTMKYNMLKNDDINLHCQ